MTRPLTARRRTKDTGWSQDMKEFLGDTLDEAIGVKPKLRPVSRDAVRHARENGQEPDYIVKKRALHSSLIRKRESEKKKIEDEYKNDLKRFHKYQESLKNHPVMRTKPLHDDQIIERVINSRNEEYYEASMTLPEGKVADLRKRRTLPPDTSGYVKSAHRVFYWG